MGAGIGGGGRFFFCIDPMTVMPHGYEVFHHNPQADSHSPWRGCNQGSVSPSGQQCVPSSCCLHRGLPDGHSSYCQKLG